VSDNRSVSGADLKCRITTATPSKMTGLGPGRLIHEGQCRGGFDPRALYPEDVLVVQRARLTQPGNGSKDRREPAAANHSRDQVYRLRAAGRRKRLHSRSRRNSHRSGDYVSTTGPRDDIFGGQCCRVPTSFRQSVEGNIRLTTRRGRPYRAPGRSESPLPARVCSTKSCLELACRTVEVRRVTSSPNRRVARRPRRIERRWATAWAYEFRKVSRDLLSAAVCSTSRSRSAKENRRPSRRGEHVGLGIACFV